MSAIAVSADTHGKSSVIPKRNQTMELCKFIASFFVVFIHAPFPGKLGGLVDCLARFAVPMFFMISGYFNYQATSRQVLRRLKHILALFLIGALFRQFCICLSIELNGGSTIAHLLTVIPESDEIMRLLILQIPPYTGHLWYLCAMMVCYLIFWLFVRFQEECRANYTVFYVLGGALFSIFFALDVIAPASGAMELEIHMRNGWFFGLPLFASGVFIHQYQQQILRIFSSSAWKLTVVIGLGMLLSILQWDSLGIGILPFGTIFEVAALMLLMISHPQVPFLGEKAACTLGALSMWIYLLHLPLYLFFRDFFREPFLTMFPKMGTYLEPLVIAAISLVAAGIFECLSRVIKKYFRYAARRK